MLMLETSNLPIVLDGQELLCSLFGVMDFEDDDVHILNYCCVGCEYGGNKVIKREQGRRLYLNAEGEVREDSFVEWPLQVDDLILVLFEDEGRRKIVGCEFYECFRPATYPCDHHWGSPEPVRWYTFDDWYKVYGGQYPKLAARLVFCRSTPEEEQLREQIYMRSIREK